MPTSDDSLDDPLIDEVRRRRQQLWEERDCDLRKLYERIQELQRTHPEQLVHRPDTQPAEPAS